MQDMRPAGCNDAGFRGNCGLAAIATLIQGDYHEVEQAYRDMYGKKANWKGATRLHDRVRFLQTCGAEVEELLLQRMNVKNTCACLDPSKRYMIRTGGHAMALVNGYLVDQYGTWDPDHPRKARKIVSNVHEVRV